MNMNLDFDFPNIPYVAYIGLTYKCNCNCTHCYAHSRIDYSRRRLTTNDYFNLLEDLYNMGTVTVTYSHGETLLNDDWLAIFSHAHELGLNQTLISNGILLNREIINLLKQSGISTILVSMDSITEEKHDANRGIKGCYSKMINAIKLLGEMTDIKSGLAVTIASRNQDELEKIVRFAIENHIDFISLLTERDCGVLADIDLKLVIDIIKKYHNLIDIVTHDYRLQEYVNFIGFETKREKMMFYADNCCRNFESQLSIDTYGDIRSCNFLEKIYGNYFNEGLKETWMNICQVGKYTMVRCEKHGGQLSERNIY